MHKKKVIIMQTENQSPKQTDNNPTTEANNTLLTVEVIEGAIAKGAKSLTDIARHLGKKGTISGKLAKQIKSLVPDIATRLKANTPPAKAKAAPKAKKSPKADKQSKASGKYRRHPQNPFRDGSGYALAFDILATHPKGIIRSDLTEEYAKAAKKPFKNASYDIAVLLSPKAAEASSERHKSCREGYGIRKENNHVELVLP